MPVRGGSGSGNLVLVVKARVEEALTEEQQRLLQNVWPEWKAPTVANPDEGIYAVEAT